LHFLKIARAKFVWRYVRWKSAWAYHLDAIVEDPDVNIIGDAVVAMQNRVRNNLMESEDRILDRFEAV
jgi:hypothetical protein